MYDSFNSFYARAQAIPLRLANSCDCQLLSQTIHAVHYLLAAQLTQFLPRTSVFCASLNPVTEAGSLLRRTRGTRQ